MDVYRCSAVDAEMIYSMEYSRKGRTDIVMLVVSKDCKALAYSSKAST